MVEDLNVVVGSSKFARITHHESRTYPRHLQYRVNNQKTIDTVTITYGWIENWSCMMYCQPSNKLKDGIRLSERSLDTACHHPLCPSTSKNEIMHWLNDHEVVSIE
jgi:hypothetical protein